MDTTGIEDRQRHNHEVLDAVKLRRDDFYEAILGLERALAVPAGASPELWAGMVAAQVGRVRGVLDAHVRGTEGEEGLFEQLREDAPHLLPMVQRLGAAHDSLIAQAEALGVSLERVGSADDVDRVRDASLDLMRALLEHRHRGAELLYDAYQVDLSPGD
jgi:hypothetical protein